MLTRYSYHLVISVFSSLAHGIKKWLCEVDLVDSLAEDSKQKKHECFLTSSNSQLPSKIEQVSEILKERKKQ